MPSKFILIDDNLAISGRSTLTGGAWSMALANMQVRPLSQVARSGDLLLASTQFQAVLDKPRLMNALVLVRHTISLAGRIRVRLHGDAARTQLIWDSLWLTVWPAVNPSTQLPWEGSNWWSGQLD